MKLTEESFKKMVQDFRALYGPTCFAALDKNEFIYNSYLKECQKHIPNELVYQMTIEYGGRHTEEPIIPKDIWKSYLEKMIADDNFNADPIGKIRLGVMYDE